MKRDYIINSVGSIVIVSAKSMKVVSSELNASTICSFLGPQSNPYFKQVTIQLDFFTLKILDSKAVDI